MKKTKSDKVDRICSNAPQRDNRRISNRCKLNPELMNSELIYPTS